MGGSRQAQWFVAVELVLRERDVELNFFPLDRVYLVSMNPSHVFVHTLETHLPRHQELIRPQLRPWARKWRPIYSPSNELFDIELQTFSS